MKKSQFESVEKYLKWKNHNFKVRFVKLLSNNVNMWMPPKYFADYESEKPMKTGNVSYHCNRRADPGPTLPQQ